MAASFVLTVLAMAYTTGEAATRYGIYLLFGAGAGYGVLLQQLSQQTKKGRRSNIRYLMAILPVIVCAAGALSYNYRNLIKNDHMAQSAYGRIAAEMQVRGVKKGYATFDWANTITVVSNDTVHVRPVNNMKDLEGSKWLANETWYPPYTEQECPVVYITTAYTRETFLETAEMRNIRISEELAVEEYTLFFTAMDYTIWKD